MTSLEIDTLSEIEDLITRKGAYRAQSCAAQLLSGLGIHPKRHEDESNTLSGGCNLCVLLSQLLFIEPEILLSDEPTNHLDILSIQPSNSLHKQTCSHTHSAWFLLIVE